MQGFFSTTETTRVHAPMSLLPKCGQCRLYKTCSSPKMQVTGNGQKEILIVAEAPGKEEDARGVQLVGNSGKELTKKLRRLGVKMREDCWLTNSVICRPPENRTPTNQEIVSCRPNLIKTVRDLDPKIIILLGGSAVRSLVGWQWKESIGAITRWVGHEIPSQSLNCWIAPTYHPSYLLRSHDDSLDKLFLQHLERAIRHTRRPWRKRPDWANQVQRVYEPGEAANLLRKMEKRGGWIAFDYETNALKPDGKESKIITCSVCWQDKKTISFPWQGEAVSAMRKLLRSSTTSKIAANLKFEERWTQAKLKTSVRNWGWDTMLATHVLDNRQGVCSLKFQSFVQLGMGDYDSHIHHLLQARNGKLNRIHEIELEDLLLYNGLDSMLEFKLAKKQMSLFGKEMQ